MKKSISNFKPMSITIGTALLTSLATSPVHATPNTANPFTLTELSSGYHQLAENEGQCGASKMSVKQGKEASCGAAKEKPVTEGKCGEGKCGTNKKK